MHARSLAVAGVGAKGGMSKLSFVGEEGKEEVEVVAVRREDKTGARLLRLDCC